jgi:Lrp/AsnC family transcriptional regulator, leucine-responsive regulatory protein
MMPPPLPGRTRPAALDAEPYSSLGAEVGLTPHGAANRVRRLVEADVITGFSAQVNLGTVGRAIDAIVDVRLLAGTTPEEFESTVAQLHAIRELAFVTGRYDYYLRVACRDTDDLNGTVRALREKNVAAHTETRIVLGSTVYDRAIG